MYNKRRSLGKVLESPLGQPSGTKTEILSLQQTGQMFEIHLDGQNVHHNIDDGHQLLPKQQNFTAMRAYRVPADNPAQVETVVHPRCWVCNCVKPSFGNPKKSAIMSAIALLHLRVDPLFLFLSKLFVFSLMLFWWMFFPILKCHRPLAVRSSFRFEASAWLFSFAPARVYFLWDLHAAMRPSPLWLLPRRSKEPRYTKAL